MRITASILGLAALVAGASAAAEPGDLTFKYSYPPQAHAIAPLNAWFQRDAAQVRAKDARDAAADRRDAVKSGRPFHPYEADRTWKVVTDLPRFLSLSLVSYDYTGGAHGMTVFGSFDWDRQTRQRMAPIAFFSGKAALSGAIRTPFCRQLSAERARKRQGFDGTMLSDFTKCIDPIAETVILGSAGHRGFDRIGILIAPYDAGPYAEGSYEVTVPVTPAVIAAVKPQWRRYFAVSGR